MTTASRTGSLTLLHVRGVPIRLHWTLLLVLPYFAWVISAQFGFIERTAGMEHVRLLLPPLVWGGLLALGLFASIALHELAHTFVTTHYGGRVREITLMLLGGVSQATRVPRRPLHEGLMALAGPAVSIGLGIGLFLVDVAIGGRTTDDVQLGLFYLAWMNITLGVFNLIPAFPMDGGRVLRASLAGWLGRDRATQIAAGIGRFLAIGFGGLALWSGNWLLMLIAVFVFVGGTAEARTERLRSVLAGLRVGDLAPGLRQPPVTIDVGETLAVALARMHELGRLDLIVLDSAGALVSVLEARELAFIPAEGRLAIRVGDFLRERPRRHVIVSWDVSVVDALETAVEANARHLVVVDSRRPAGSQIIGAVTPSEIEIAAELQLMDTPRVLPPAARAAPST